MYKTKIVSFSCFDDKEFVPDYGIKILFYGQKDIRLLNLKIQIAILFFCQIETININCR